MAKTAKQQTPEEIAKGMEIVTVRARVDLQYDSAYQRSGDVFKMYRKDAAPHAVEIVPDSTPLSNWSPQAELDAMRQGAPVPDGPAPVASIETAAKDVPPPNRNEEGKLDGGDGSAKLNPEPLEKTTEQGKLQTK